MGKGRKRAMRYLGRSWNSLLAVCPEVADLEVDIQRWLENR